MAYQNVTPVKLGQAIIPVSPSTLTLYTVPASTRTYLKDIDICNTGATTITATIYIVSSGGSPSTNNIFIPAINIPPNGMFQWSGSQIMNMGDFLVVTASATGLNIIVSGGEAV